MTRPKYSKLNGFSLVELLSVLALVGLLSGLASISLRGNSSALNLGIAGTRCANLLSNAREIALLKKSPVAVVFIPADSQQPAAISLLEYRQNSASWIPVSKWETLPNGVVFDASIQPDSNSAIAANSPVISPALPAIERGGKSFQPGAEHGYGFLVFLPSGALHQSLSRPGFLRLVEGNMNGNILSYLGKTDSDGKPENYFEVVVNSSTGRSKIVRPE